MSSGGADGVRKHRARQEIHAERDKLLKRADKKNDVSRFLPNDSKDRARAILITSGLGVLGQLPYLTMILLWFFVYHDSFVQTFTMLAVLVAVGLLFLIGSTRRALGKERPWMWWFGSIWLQATVVGTTVGFFLYFRDLAYYWKYQEMRTYTNIAAAQDSSAFGDGSMFLFTEDSSLDTMRAVGFKSRWTGDIYCVAPVVDVTMSQADEIFYWAVGDNCCPQRAEFLCDDAGDYTTRSALKVLQPEDVVRPFMTWAVRGSTYDHFIEAVRMQEATYGDISALSPTLVKWTKDPVGYKNAFFNNAQTVCIWVSVVYELLVLVGCYFIAWRLIPKQKHEGVIRHTQATTS
mmetsp:Transcript_81783/g.205785  ORF Transcript_81783/g.205785 Transcript_81783/m.205785 type:complete len:348 (-) Transcript_81783:60-1103(-)